MTRSHRPYWTDYAEDDERCDPVSASPSLIRTVAIIVAIEIVFLIVAIWMLTMPASAHDAPAGWTYDVRCCSGIDCRQVERVAVIEGPNGYVIRATGETIPYTSPKIRPSQDGDFHWCSRGGRPDSETICLYVPHGGS